MAAKKKPTQAQRIRALLDAGMSRAAVRFATQASRQAIADADAARRARGRPKKLEGGESVRVYLSRDTAAWLRAEAARRDCSIGELVDLMRLEHERASALVT